MNMYVLNWQFEYWVEVGVETKFGQKNSLSGYVHFFPNLDKKAQVSRFERGFGGNL
jgi:hypothetical protein